MEVQLSCVVGQKCERDNGYANGSKPAGLFELTTRPPEEREARGEKAGAIGEPLGEALIQAGNESKKDQDESNADPIDDLVCTDHATIIADLKPRKVSFLGTSSKQSGHPLKDGRSILPEFTACLHSCRLGILGIVLRHANLLCQSDFRQEPDAPEVGIDFVPA